MIVKVELLKDSGWRFIADVCNVEIRGQMNKDPNGNECWEREILIFKNDVCHEKLIVGGKQQVYLCNDEGKTIERIN